MRHTVKTQGFQRAVTWGLAALVIYLLFLVANAFWVPLTWGAVLTIFFFPLHRRVLWKVESGNLAALLTVTIVTILLVAPVVWLVPAFVREAASVIGHFRSEEFLPKARVWAEEELARLPIPLGSFEDIVDEVGRKSRALLAEQSARLAGNVVVFLLHLVVMLLTMFYLFRDGPNVVRLLKEISPLGGDYSERMRKEVSDLISVTLSSGFVVSVVQGILGGLVFWILGIPSPLFWGVIIAFLAFLPIVGPWLIWIPAAAGAMINGDIVRGVALAILGFVLISGADNVLRPILIAGRSQLNGLLVLVGVLGGISAFGLLGVVLGPLVMATAVGMLKGYRESLLEHDAAPPAQEAA